MFSKHKDIEGGAVGTDECQRPFPVLHGSACRRDLRLVAGLDLPPVHRCVASKYSFCHASKVSGLNEETAINTSLRPGFTPCKSCQAIFSRLSASC